MRMTDFQLKKIYLFFLCVKRLTLLVDEDDIVYMECVLLAFIWHRNHICRVWRIPNFKWIFHASWSCCLPFRLSTTSNLHIIQSLSLSHPLYQNIRTNMSKYNTRPKTNDYAAAQNTQKHTHPHTMNIKANMLECSHFGLRKRIRVFVCVSKCRSYDKILNNGVKCTTQSFRPKCERVK